MIAVTKSRNKPLYRAQSRNLSDGAPLCAMALDPYIAGMCDALEMLGAPAPCCFADVRMLRAQAAIMTGLAVAGATWARPYVASPATAHAARCLAIREGVRRPPHRPSADERCKAEARRWGLLREAVGS